MEPLFAVRMTHDEDMYYNQVLASKQSAPAEKPGKKNFLSRVDLSDVKMCIRDRYYTHFTSPIRRYPDLQIHRIIKENLHGRLGEKRLSHYGKLLPEAAVWTSSRERLAEEAERETEKAKKVQYMRCV